MFIYIVNSHHANELEWERVRAIGRQSVEDAHNHLARFRIRKKRERIGYILQGIASLIVWTCIFIFVGLIVLLR